MDELLSWLLFPVVVAALALGCGLLLEVLSRDRLPGGLLPVGGLAVVIVIARFATAWSVTAELATPAVVAAALVGYGLTDRSWRDMEGWALAAALGVFAVYAAPVVLSGQTGFAGYIKLDDTATWFAITDRVMEHGSDLSGLAPSSYQAALHAYIGDGYPTGAYLPLGVGRTLVGQDLAWVFAPYLALLAALLSLAFSELVRPLLSSRPLRAAVCFLAPLAALLYGYTMWGGVKELTVAPLIAGLAGFGALLLDSELQWRRLLPVAVSAAALMAVLSPGGAVWIAPILLPLAVAVYRRGGSEALLRPAARLAGLTALLCIPLIAVGRLLPPVENALNKQDALINLFHPLSPLQLFGIWPVEDFRLVPDDLLITDLLVAVVAALAVAGAILAWRARAWALLLYLCGALGGCLIIVIPGSPWVDSKAMTIAAPAVPLVALAAAAAIATGRRRIEAGLALAAIAAGVLWSVALTYRGVSLAPHDQLAELERIGEKAAGEGPTLMTEYQPYGVRHFLRDADPEAVSELRVRTIPLRNGQPVPKGGSADTDEIDLQSLLVYRTLVLRRSPAQSRPPSTYGPISQGHYYETWQTAGDPGALLEHLPLGAEVDPGAVPDCAEVGRLAGLSGANMLVAAARREPIVIEMGSTDHPLDWEQSPPGAYLTPTGGGSITAQVTVPETGTYTVWLGGSVRGRMTLSVDGVRQGSVRGELNHTGDYVQLASVPMTAGTHTLVLDYGGADLRPGSGGMEVGLGPLVLSADDANSPLAYVQPADARSALCGKRWDWIEAVR